MDGNRRKGVFNEFSVMDVANSKSIYGYGFLFKNEDSIKGIGGKRTANILLVKKYFGGLGVFDALLVFGYI